MAFVKDCPRNLPLKFKVARTNVAWTNAKVTVGFCSQDPMVKVKIRFVTAEILLPKSLCGSGG